MAQTYSIVALQMNIGAGSPRKGKRDNAGAKPPPPARVTLRRPLIKTYVEGTLSHKFPQPAFIALCDKVSGLDSSNIINAFKTRDGEDCVKLKDCREGEAQRDTRLLYDENVLDLESDDSDNLGVEGVEGRITGGLFTHKPSRRSIVAFSYHGARKEVEVQMGILKGIGLFSFVQSLMSLALSNALKEKYSDKNPVYLLAGDFNCDLELHKSYKALESWEICPKVKTRETIRQLRKYPIDYFALADPEIDNQFDEIEVKTFSPLPIMRKEDLYTFSNDKDVFLERIRAFSLDEIKQLSEKLSEKNTKPKPKKKSKKRNKSNQGGGSKTLFGNLLLTL
jgi:hypothetical protein